MQEAVQQRPKDAEFWALLSKVTSDMTYLDEIQGEHREKLTDADKRAFNKQAMEHAKKVGFLRCIDGAKSHSLQKAFAGQTRTLGLRPTHVCCCCWVWLTSHDVCIAFKAVAGYMQFWAATPCLKIC